ncbi:glycosyltransferase [Candidatus Daviesbacteria bacterium]|nr:glycosyltransferase [Candidatus Daviesbacteria bacterium]
MYRKLSKEQKKALLERIRAGERLSKLAREAKISRTIIYKWLSKKSLFPQYPKGSVHPRKIPKFKEKEIVKAAIKHPSLSIAGIAQATKLSTYFVWQTLKRYRLSTKEDKRIYIERNGNSLVKEVPVNDRVMMLRRFENGDKVTQICKDFNVSRTVFYRWLKRYQQLEEKNTESLVGLRPRGESHWRFIPGAEDLVLKLVLSNPKYSAHQISRKLEQTNGKPIISSFGVHKILKKHNLNIYEKRLVYARGKQQTAFPYQEEPAPVKQVFGSIPGVSSKPPPRAGYFFNTRSFLIIFAIAFFFAVFTIPSIASITKASSLAPKLGMILAYVSLTFGMVFFLYSLKYYISIALILLFSRKTPTELGLKQPMGLTADLHTIDLDRKPFVSIHLAVYNEKRVLEKLLTAATAQEYKNYEVIVVDDSTDGSKDIIKSFLKKRRGEFDEAKNDNYEIFISAPFFKNEPKITVIHRYNRAGFKGGALNKALNVMDPRSEYVVILDADFIPYPDTIIQFLKYFKLSVGSLELNCHPRPDRGSINNVQVMDSRFRGNDRVLSSNIAAIPAYAEASAGYCGSNVAAVQGYQWHVLNKSENWITRGGKE